MEGSIYITNYQFRPRSIIVYNAYQGPRRTKTSITYRNSNINEARKLAYSGNISKGSRKRMKKAIALLTESTPERIIYNPVIQKYHSHKLSFLTLTIADNFKNYTSKEAYQTCLRPLLQWLTKYKGVRLYIWKAELQKRGQIHYHIVTPQFIEWNQIREKWNYLQWKAGYLEEFKAKHGHTNPNSTDIHSMRKVKNAAAYLTKYLTKDPVKKNTEAKEEGDKEIKLDGKIWDCSKILKECNYYCTEQNPKIEDNIQELVKAKKARIEHIDYCSIVTFNEGKPSQVLPLSELMKLQQYYTYIQGGYLPINKEKSAA